MSDNETDDDDVSGLHGQPDDAPPSRYWKQTLSTDKVYGIAFYDPPEAEFKRRPKAPMPQEPPAVRRREPPVEPAPPPQPQIPISDLIAKINFRANAQPPIPPPPDKPIALIAEPTQKTQPEAAPVVAQPVPPVQTPIIQKAQDPQPPSNKARRSYRSAEALAGLITYPLVFGVPFLLLAIGVPKVFLFVIWVLTIAFVCYIFPRLTSWFYD